MAKENRPRRRLLKFSSDYKSAVDTHFYMVLNQIYFFIIFLIFFRIKIIHNHLCIFFRYCFFIFNYRLSFFFALKSAGTILESGGNFGCPPTVILSIKLASHIIYSPLFLYLGIKLMSSLIVHSLKGLLRHSSKSIKLYLSLQGVPFISLRIILTKLFSCSIRLSENNLSSSSFYKPSRQLLEILAYFLPSYIDHRD